MQQGLLLTGGEEFVVDEYVKCRADSVREEGNEETDSSAPAPKRRHIELEASSPKPDLVETIEQLKKETEELKNQLPGEEKSDNTQDIMQQEEPLTGDEFDVVDDVRERVDSVPEEGIEETNADSPAPKQVAPESPAPEPDLVQTVALLEKEAEELRKQLHVQEEMRKVLEDIREMMDSQGKALQRFLGRVTEQYNEPTVDDPADSAIIKLLPLSTQQSLQQLEQHLSTAKNRADLVAHLSRVHRMDYLSRGHGLSMQRGAPHLMRRCMCDKLAQEFSFTGRKGKWPFNSLQLSRVITDTLLRNYPTTEHSVYHAIADWLRHAPGRHRKRESISSAHLSSP